MKVVSVPRIRHGQKINQKQAQRFFRNARAWLENANRRIAKLKNSSPSVNFIQERTGKIRSDLDKVGRNLEWLADRGFKDRSIDMLLEKTLGRLEKLFECRNNHL